MMVPRIPILSLPYRSQFKLKVYADTCRLIISERVLSVLFLSGLQASLQGKSHICECRNDIEMILVSSNRDTFHLRPSSFSFHVYEERLTLLRLNGFSKLHLWFPYLSFQGGSAAYVYSFSSLALPEFTVTLYGRL